MAEKMSLEMALSVIDRSIRLLAASGFEDHAKELLEARLPVSAAFAQPAQAVDVPYDNALNDAGWAFTEAMPVSLPARIFNNVKPALKAAIEKWLQVRAIGNAQEEST